MDADGREWGREDGAGERVARRWGEGVVGWALTDFPRQGAGMFPTAPLAQQNGQWSSVMG